MYIKIQILHYPMFHTHMFPGLTKHLLATFPLYICFFVFSCFFCELLELSKHTKTQQTNHKIKRVKSPPTKSKNATGNPIGEILGLDV